jgi:hypothetical protein
MYRADDKIIVAQTPVLGATQFGELTQSTLPPCRHRRQAQSLEDDAVHLGAQQELRESELLLRGEDAHGLVRDREKYAPRNGLLVVLDLTLEIQFVLVLERAGRSLRHYGKGLEDASKLEHSFNGASGCATESYIKCLSPCLFLSEAAKSLKSLVVRRQCGSSRIVRISAELREDYAVKSAQNLEFT